MEIKIFPVLLCALFLLWTTQELHGYVGPFTGRKKNEIWHKVSLLKTFSFRSLFRAASDISTASKNWRNNWLKTARFSELKFFLGENVRSFELHFSSRARMLTIFSTQERFRLYLLNIEIKPPNGNTRQN